MPKLPTSILCAGYLAILVFGYFRMPASQTPRAGFWTATAELQANHQLHDGDLRLPEGWSDRVGLPTLESQLGKHLRSTMPSGGRVTAADLASLPALRAGTDDVFVYSLANDSAVARLLGPNALVKACYWTAETQTAPAAARCVDPSFPVLAVHNALSDKDASWVALRVAPDRGREFGAFLAATTKYLLIADEQPSGSTNSR
jgi:hypothetical protein